jgi:hypothetical protein
MLFIKKINHIGLIKQENSIKRLENEYKNIFSYFFSKKIKQAEWKISSI